MLELATEIELDYNHEPETIEHETMSIPEAKKRVLVVDDDADFLFQEKVQLAAAGFEVLTAESQAQAEELLARERIDIAILDLMMDNMDAGFVLCYHIKKKDPTIPVILVTSVNSETDYEFDTTTSEERSWIKADAFLAKPIRFEQLQGEIDRLLKE